MRKQGLAMIHTHSDEVITGRNLWTSTQYKEVGVLKFALVDDLWKEAEAPDWKSEGWRGEDCFLHDPTIVDCCTAG